MSHRLRTSLSTVAAVVVIVSLSAVPAVAQSDAPRTAWGQADLQGFGVEGGLGRHLAVTRSLGAANGERYVGLYDTGGLSPALIDGFFAYDASYTI